MILLLDGVMRKWELACNNYNRPGIPKPSWIKGQFIILYGDFHLGLMVPWAIFSRYLLPY